MTRTEIARTVSGHIVTRDDELVARAIKAIEARRLNEVELSFGPARKSNVRQFPRRGVERLG